jgi:hypothetical protein
MYLDTDINRFSKKEMRRSCGGGLDAGRDFKAAEKNRRCERGLQAKEREKNKSVNVVDAGGGGYHNGVKKSERAACAPMRITRLIIASQRAFCASLTKR